jgi:CBS domain-containing protein
VDAEQQLVGIATADDLVSLLAAELSGLAVAIRAQVPRADSDRPPAPAPTEVAARHQKEVATIADRDSVRSAAEAMKSRAVGSLVVLHDGAAVGILTDRDLLVRVVAEGRNAATTTAADVMSHPLQIACPEDPLDRVIETMSARGFRRVPVLDGGALVGIVALDDVLGELADELHDLVTGMRRELAVAQRVARARELAREAVDRVGELGEQLEGLGVEAKNRLFRELDGLRERIRGRER